MFDCQNNMDSPKTSEMESTSPADFGSTGTNESKSSLESTPTKATKQSLLLNVIPSKTPPATPSKDLAVTPTSSESDREKQGTNFLCSLKSNALCSMMFI